MNHTGNVAEHPGWEVATYDMKLFLEMLPLYRSKKECSLALGHGERWSESTESRYPAFKEMVHIRENQTGSIGGFAEVARGEIIMRLFRILRGSEDDSLSLKAAAMLEKYYGKSEKPATNGAGPKVHPLMGAANESVGEASAAEINLVG